MALYGLMVSVLAVVLGLGGVGWIPALIWLVLVTSYFAVPRSAFKRIEALAKERHIEAARAEAGATTTREQDGLAIRVERYRGVRMNPMRLSHSLRVPVAVSVALPMILNVADPFIKSLLPK